MKRKVFAASGCCIVHMDPQGSQLAETLHDPPTGEMLNGAVS